MTDYRKTATAVGVLFILGTVAGIGSAVVTGPAMAAATRGALSSGAFLVLVMGLALALVPLLLYPLLSRVDPRLALGYVVFRTGLEMVTYLAMAGLWITLGGLGGQGAQIPGLAPVLLGLANSSQIMTIFVFSLGAMMLYWLLYRSRLLPRWLSLWGLGAIVLYLATGFAQLFGLATSASMALPLLDLPTMVQELAMAAWLVAKGFDRKALVRLEEART
jgi:hypothetical protein